MDRPGGNLAHLIDPGHGWPGITDRHGRRSFFMERGAWRVARGAMLMALGAGPAYSVTARTAGAEYAEED